MSSIPSNVSRARRCWSTRSAGQPPSIEPRALRDPVAWPRADPSCARATTPSPLRPSRSSMTASSARASASATSIRPMPTSLVESSLAEANDLLLSAKQIASTQVNIGTTQEERENQSAGRQLAHRRTLTQMNRKSVDNYLSGQQKSTPPFEAFGSGFIYTGEFDRHHRHQPGQSVPVTLVGIDSIGDELSKVKAMSTSPHRSRPTHSSRSQGTRRLASPRASSRCS